MNTQQRVTSDSFGAADHNSDGLTHHRVNPSPCLVLTLIDRDRRQLIRLKTVLLHNFVIDTFLLKALEPFLNGVAQLGFGLEHWNAGEGNREGFADEHIAVRLL